MLDFSLCPGVPVRGLCVFVRNKCHAMPRLQHRRFKLPQTGNAEAGEASDESVHLPWDCSKEYL